MERLANRFILEREVGSGGMSTVYLGRDEVLGRPVAVKVLKSGFAGTDVGDRFQREGKTSASLSHPNIVPVYDAGEGEIGGREVSFIVMEHVSGGDLKDLLDERGPLGKKELSRIGRELSAGLAHAHERGVIHRDVKPHNILLDDAGHPKLTDFGIARALEATRFTQTGSYLGTALYSSPEQLRGRNVTTKSDVYSLGATLYQAAVGTTPFQGTAMEVAEKHISREPKPPAELRPGVDGDLSKLILACLAKDPDSRPTSRDVEARLAELSDASSTARTTTAGARPVPPDPPTVASASPRSSSPRSSSPKNSGSRRRPPSAAVLAALAVAAMLFLAGVLFAPPLLDGGNDESASRQNASQENASQENASPSGGAVSDSSGNGVSENPGESGGEEESDASDGSSDSGTSEGLSEEAAAGAVEGFYTTAADEDYGSSAEYLSAGYRSSQFSNEGVFEGTFSSLESISFVGEPEVEVTGSTASVSGTTEAVHTDRTERNTATWTLVAEGGEWKLDGITIQNQEIV